MNISESEIHKFLHFGYLPSYDSSSLPAVLEFLESRTTEPRSADPVRHGVAIIQKIVDRMAARFADSRLIVPLSGGLDSRAILACLLKSPLAEQIVTVTYGVPGAFDYELGNRVAAVAKTEHIAIDLNLIPFSKKQLLEDVQNGLSWTPVFDGYFNRRLIERFTEPFVVFSGFMGDPLAGAHLCDPTMPDAMRVHDFVEKQRVVKSMNLLPRGVHPELGVALPTFSRLTVDEHLDFFVRQTSYILKVLTKPGVAYAFPFIERDWVEFILNQPYGLRKNQILYEEILKRLDPRLFSIGVKKNLGLRLGASQNHIRVMRAWYMAESLIRCGPKRRCRTRYVNYRDYDQVFRQASETTALFSECMQSLAQRNVLPWINPVQIMADHVSGRAQLSDAILLLGALELNLQVAYK